jgi:hypothetical protein
MRAGVLFIVALSALALSASFVVAASSSSPQTFDVTTYGAVGDGRTDDSQAVYKAGKMMEECNCVGVLYFPRGTYVLKAPATGTSGDPFINLARPGQWTMIGDGVGVTILKWESQTGQLLNVEVHDSNNAAASLAATTSFTLANLSVSVEPIPPDWEAQYNVFNLQGSGDHVRVSNIEIHWQPRSVSVGVYAVRAASLTVNNVNSFGPGEGQQTMDTPRCHVAF